MSIACRPARMEDLERIVEFQRSMARATEDCELDLETLRRGVSAVLETPSLGRYWVAEAGGTAIGSLMLTFEWSDWRNRMVWWIQSVWIEPEWRRRGVYASLYRHVQALAMQDPSVAGIRLYVDQRNRAAQEVYRRLGMNGDHYTTFEWMKEGVEGG